MTKASLESGEKVSRTSEKCTWQDGALLPAVDLPFLALAASLIRALSEHPTNVVFTCSGLHPCFSKLLTFDVLGVHVEK